MNIDDRRKKWDEMYKGLTKSEKHFSKYGLTKSLFSHNEEFLFYQIINEYPNIKVTQKEFVISKFAGYLKLIDIEIKRGLVDKEITRFNFKVFLDMYCYVLQKEMLQKYIDLVKSGKSNDEQIITDFTDEYLKFLHNGILELKRDRKHYFKIITSVINIEKPLDKLYEIKLFFSKSLLGHSPTAGSKQVKKLIQDTIRAKRGSGTSPSQGETIKNLFDAFETTSKYNHIMNLLVEKGFCNVGNYAWVNRDSNKGTAIYLLRYLHTQGYYKNNRELTNKEKVEIAQNTFGVKISESYAKQCKLEDNRITKLIPLASTIK